MKIAAIMIPAVLVACMAAGIACGAGVEENLQSATAEPTQMPAGQEVWVTDRDSGSYVTLELGDSLILAMASNPTTGYSWSLVSISDESVLQKVSDEYVPYPTPTGEPMVGSGGEEIWTFAPLKAGSATIEMMYSRPWESGEPAARFNLSVTVD